MSSSFDTNQASLVWYSICPALAPGDNPDSSEGQNIVAAGGGVQVIPEEIGVGVDRGNSLGTGANVYQRVSGWRGDDAIEECKDVELHEIEVPARVEVTQDTKACGQDVVI